MLELNKIYNVDVREGLKSLPDNSVDMCMTSPPYWALRSYGTEPQVWSGTESCTHEWGEAVEGAGKNNDQSAGEIQRGNKGSIGRDNRPTSNFCQLCGAWKGELGLEPTFQLYLEHLLSVFDEVRRVLKPSGVAFVNMGSTYLSEKTFIVKEEYYENENGKV